MTSQRKLTSISLAMGAIFVALGLLEISAVWMANEWLDLLASNGNILMGLVLILTGAIYGAAAKGYGDPLDNEAYAMVACMLGLFVGLVALLTLLADASEAYLLNNEDFVDWVPLDDFTPAIVMVVPCAALLRYHLRSFRSVVAGEAPEAGGPA